MRWKGCGLRQVLILVLTAGCGTDLPGPERGVQDVGTRNSALEAEADVEVACRPEVDSPPLVLSMDDLRAGPADRGRDESLTLTIASFADEPLRAVVSLHSLTKYGQIDAVLTEVALGARETTQVELPVADLRLAEGAFEHSANLTLFAAPRKENGESLVASKLSVFYHPRDGGIVFYDDVTRVAEFDSGALTEQARARRAEVEAVNAGDDVVVVYTGEWLIGPRGRSAEQEEP